MKLFLSSSYLTLPFVGRCVSVQGVVSPFDTVFFFDCNGASPSFTPFSFCIFLSTFFSSSRLLFSTPHGNSLSLDVAEDGPAYRVTRRLLC